MKQILLMSLLMLGAIVNAQSSDEKPYIEVSGQSERFVTPDEIYLQVTISADKANEFQELESKTMKVLKKLGITSEDITLADAQGEEVSAWFRDGFETQRMLLVQVSTANMVNDVMDNLHGVGIKEIRITKVDYSQKEALMNDLRIEAMKNAKMKSELMLAAIDAKLGMPLLVRENSWGTRPVPEKMIRSALNYDMSMKSKSADYDISFKKLKYKSEVTVRFEIAK